MRRRTVALTSALVAGAIISTSGPAIAKVHYEYDPAGDVRYIDIDDGDTNAEDNVSIPAPQREHGDILRTRISHGSSKVRISVQYRALAPGGLRHFHTVYIGSDRGGFTLSRIANPGNWSGGQTTVIGPSGSPPMLGPIYRCPGVYSRIDYVNDRFLAEVPRACLRHPKWIKVRTTMAIHVDTQSGYRVYEDQGFSNGDATPDALSPKVLPSFTESVIIVN